ncbi:MAG: methionine ABC transporter ATP-binding protein [Firmicutes bacterium]|nr:methionine ABC transporter ATP-binding protein [Bacillota bacterium]
MIKIRGLTKIYTDGQRELRALDNVSLDVKPGEIFGIIGLSGAGKSTLVRCINMLERPQEGQVLVNGIDMTALSKGDLRKARQKIGMIFQHFNLLSSRTVFGNVAFPLEITGIPKAEIRERVYELLRLVGLEDKADSYPAQLSGGQKQRVGIARALANRPEVLLCDEATSALDPETTTAVLELLQDINRKMGLTILLITHEMPVIQQVCDRVAVIENGRIVECGPVLDVFTRPETEEARRLVRGVIDIEIPPDLLEQHANGDGPLLKISFIGDSAGRPIMGALMQRFPVMVNILFGRIDHVKDTPFGTLVVQLSGENEAIAEATEFLAGQDLHVEVLRDV